MSTDITPSNRPEYQPEAAYEGTTQGASNLRLRRFLGFLRRFWWIPLITLALGIVGEAAYVHWLEPAFVSKASMWETLKLRLPEGSLFSEDVQNFLGTQSQLLQSGALRNEALALLRANTNTANAIPIGKDGQPPVVKISVNGSAKSSVFFIEASSSNPRFTEVYLDALMHAFLEYKKSVRKEISGDTLASIGEQMQKWERDLQTEQDALTAFQRTNNLAILQEEGTIAGGYLAKLKTQLSDLDLEARLLEASVNGTNHGSGAQGDGAPRPMELAGGQAASQSAAMERQSTYREIELLKLQRAKLSKNLRPKHPKIVKLNADIERGEKLQEIYGRQDRDQLASSRQSNELRRENIQTAIKDWEVRVLAANSRIAEAERLRLNVQRVQSVRDRLALLVQNVGISRNIDQESLAILEPSSPAKRSYTREKSGLTMAIFGGLASGLGLVFLISLRDDRFTSIIEVNTAFGDSVVGMLPQLPQKGNVDLPLLELNDPRHIYAEAYRGLRSALLFFATDGERPKLLLITSAMPDEGKSTIAANLSRTLALAGSRVLLVDADLRKGHLHQLLKLENKVGLADLLHGTADFAAVVQATSLANFSFIARGRNAGHPGDLFLSSRLSEALARWRRDYDFVVIDSSPLFAADDASCLAPKVDGTLFVVRSHHSSARAVRQALEILAQRQARVLGVIVNGVNSSARSYYYYKYSEYHDPVVVA